MKRDLWVRVAHAMPHHPKVVGLSDRAFRFHVTYICYCGEYLTDGLVPKKEIPRRVAAELIAAGLWKDKNRNEYEIHDYLEWNQSRAQVEALRGKRAAAGLKGAETRWHKR